jgi:myo-inositol-1-phosphate synthase
MTEAREILPSRSRLGVLVPGLDLAQRAGMGSIQEWLSFYFKSPMTLPKLYPEHDLFIQHMKLKNT